MGHDFYLHLCSKLMQNLQFTGMNSFLLYGGNIPHILDKLNKLH